MASDPSPFLQVTRRNLLKAGTLATAAFGIAAADVSGLGAAPATAQTLPLSQPPETTFYVTIEGQQQGKFTGETLDKGHERASVGLAYSHEIKSPRDAASGQATGKRQHQPVTFVKEWGAATPQLYRALVTNEVLKTVLFEFLQPVKGEGKKVYFTVLLTNAHIVGIEQHAEGGTELEEISFTYQKITWTHVLSKTMAQDTWVENNT